MLDVFLPEKKVGKVVLQKLVELKNPKKSN
jgi:hypothetical protein